MKYAEPLIGFLGFLWFSLNSLTRPENRGTWQLKASALCGVAGMAFFALVVYSRHVHGAHPVVALVRTILGGVTLGTFITLWLEGSADFFRKNQKTTRHDPGERQIRLWRGHFRKTRDIHDK